MFNGLLKRKKVLIEIRLRPIERIVKEQKEEAKKGTRKMGEGKDHE